MMSHPNIVLAVSITLTLASTAIADDAAEIKKLVPAAAGMKLADFDRLATSAMGPKPSDVKSKTLTLMFFSIEKTDDEKALAEFGFLGDRPPKPLALAKEMTRNLRGVGRLRFATGPITVIHTDRITDITCKVNGTSASGTVSFTVPKLYRGKVNYIARKHDDKWRIEEFSMPARKVHIRLAKDGTWTQK